MRSPAPGTASITPSVGAQGNGISLTIDATQVPEESHILRVAAMCPGEPVVVDESVVAFGALQVIVSWLRLDKGVDFKKWTEEQHVDVEEPEHLPLLFQAITVRPS